MPSTLPEVYIIGAGSTPVVKESELSVETLGVMALKAAMDHSGVYALDSLYVGNMLSGILFHQQQLGASIANEAGLVGTEALTVEAACGSGGGALHMGIVAILSGLYDCVGVCGVEKMSHITKDMLSTGLATASDWRREGAKGQTFLSLNARLMNNYLDYYKIPHDAFSGFAVNAHQNACGNPHALFHKPITHQDYINAKIIEPPLCLYDVCPVCDGAAAIILCSKSFATTFAQELPKVLIRASTVATDTLSLLMRENILSLAGVRKSCQHAYKQAGISPSDLDIFELHDAYTILCAITLEEAGFAAPGKGWELALNGEIGLNGKIPISTLGGLKARGHPIGATGIYQCVEIFNQLTNRAGQNQVKDATLAMIQSIGGIGGTVVTHILERK